MNQDQFMSWFRTTLGGVATLAVEHGIVNGQTATAITGVVVGLVPLLWGYFVHTDSGKLAAVEALPGVEKIITGPDATDGVAAATADRDRPKVVADSPAPITSNLQRKF